MCEKKGCRDAYGEVLLELGAEYPDIVVLDADISKSTKTDYFANRYPERAFDFGVAEANMIGIAAGLATVGKIPFANTYAVFASMRACEQVRTSIAYPNLNVKIVATHGGLDVGADGVTHQAIEDIAIMRAIPNMTVIVPADAVATKKAVQAIVRHYGPVYLRLMRSSVPLIYNDSLSFKIGKAFTLQEGEDVTLMAIGIMVFKALEAARLLENEGIKARVMDIETIKPLDIEAVLKSASETGAIVTLEDHSIMGGLGGAVAEVLVENLPVPMERIGVRDVFGESGDSESLHEKYGIGLSHIVQAAKKVILRK